VSPPSTLRLSSEPESHGRLLRCGRRTLRSERYEWLLLFSAVRLRLRFRRTRLRSPLFLLSYLFCSSRDFRLRLSTTQTYRRARSLPFPGISLLDSPELGAVPSEAFLSVQGPVFFPASLGACPTYALVDGPQFRAVGVSGLVLTAKRMAIAFFGVALVSVPPRASCERLYPRLVTMRISLRLLVYDSMPTSFW